MKILVVSDIHGSARMAEQVLALVKGEAPDLTLLLGDLLYNGPRNHLPESYDSRGALEALNAIPGPLMAVRGNCDSEVDQAVLGFWLSESAWLLAEGHQLFAIHGHQLGSEKLMQRIRPGTTVLSGHTHIPRADMRDGVFYCNPGSAALPRGGFPPSYGLWENGCFRVLGFDGAVIVEGCGKW